MITIAITIVGVFLLVLTLFIFDSYDKWLLAIVPLVFGILLIIWGVKLNNAHCQVQVETRYPIYSGYNQNRIDGGFILGSGRVGEVDYVYFWMKNGNVLSKHSRPMVDSTFIEDGQNLLIVTRTECRPKWAYLPNGNGPAYEFHVPVGSVYSMQEYK